MVHSAAPDEMFAESGANALHVATLMRYTDNSCRFVELLFPGRLLRYATDLHPRVHIRLRRRQVRLAHPGARLERPVAQGEVGGEHPVDALDGAFHDDSASMVARTALSSDADRSRERSRRLLALQYPVAGC